MRRTFVLRSRKWWRRWSVAIEFHPFDWRIGIGRFPDAGPGYPEVGIQVLPFSLKLSRISNSIWAELHSIDYVQTATRGQVRRDKAKRKRVRRGGHS